MKTILVLTDFSIRAEFAAEYALNIAIKRDADLILCHAVEITTPMANTMGNAWPTTDYLFLKNDSELELKELEKRLQLIANTNTSASSKPKITAVTDFGTVADIAADVILERGVDLVVMGSHKSNSLERFVMGSHTHQILDSINCPVLLVPECLKFGGIKNIAYATDYSFNNSKVLRYLSKLANTNQSTITVTHVSSQDNIEHLVISNQTDALEKNVGCKVVYKTIKSSNVQKSLQQISGVEQLDLLALVHKRYDFFEDLFHKSISKKMAHHSKIPLLVLPYSFGSDIADMPDDELEHYCYDSRDTR